MIKKEKIRKKQEEKSKKSTPEERKEPFSYIRFEFLVSNKEIIRKAEQKMLMEFCEQLGFSQLSREKIWLEVLYHCFKTTNFEKIVQEEEKQKTAVAH